MKDLTLFYPEGHSLHFERGHPERPERVEAIWGALQAMPGFDQALRSTPLMIPASVLTGVHTPAYVQRLEASARLSQRMDADTYVTTDSYRLALQAAGGALAVARSVWRGEARRGFALTRPPGHHATPNRAMGFCLLNNIALAAEYLLQEEDASRLAIVDLDLHHGNGTQDIFWQRGDVLYISTHQFPHYPGTGALHETGEGAGQMTTANLPLPAFSGDQAFLTALEGLILPLLDRFRPEMLLVSVGFDSHWLDPLGHLLLTAGRYGELIAGLADWADTNCQERIALFLEGGYDLDAAAACAEAVVCALLGRPIRDPLGQPPWQERDAWQAVLEEVRAHWQL